MGRDNEGKEGSHCERWMGSRNLMEGRDEEREKQGERERERARENRVIIRQSTKRER